MEERFIQRLVDGMAPPLGGGRGVQGGGQRRAFPPGTVVGRKFQIDRVLGEGRRGLMVAATDLELGQPVAIKIFRAAVDLNGRGLLERFTEEAKAALRLTGGHVARVIDLAVTDDGKPYVVIEYLEGQSLDRALEERGALPVASAVEYAIQACEGLAEAHACGIVHRDINPSNLFLIDGATASPSIKVLGFGVSKFELSDGSSVTANFVRGNSRYAAPEQIRSGGWVDHRADIWSLGLTLYELLVGSAPTASFRPLRELRPELPEQLVAALSRCLAKDPDDRFDSTGKLARALLPFAPVRARGSAERAAAMVPAVRSRRPLSRRRGWLRGAPATAAPAAEGAPAPHVRRLRIASAVALAMAVCTMTTTALLGRSSRSRVMVESRPTATAPLPAATHRPGPDLEALGRSPRPVLEQLLPPPPPAPRALPAEAPAVIGRASADLVAQPRERRTPRAKPSVAAERPSSEATQAPATAPALQQQVDPAGGREPLRPIELRNPYVTP